MPLRAHTPHFSPSSGVAFESSVLNIGEYFPYFYMFRITSNAIKYYFMYDFFLFLPFARGRCVQIVSAWPNFNNYIFTICTYVRARSAPWCVLCYFSSASELQAIADAGLLRYGIHHEQHHSRSNTIIPNEHKKKIEKKIKAMSARVFTRSAMLHTNKLPGYPLLL